MSEHILSCGCKSKYFGIQAEWDTTSREGNPAVAYGVICERHWHELDARRPWSNLTNEEIEAVMHGSVEGERMLPYQFARAIEAKLKAKNETT
jgi:hypothetical protein